MSVGRGVEVLVGCGVLVAGGSVAVGSGVSVGSKAGVGVATGVQHVSRIAASTNIIPNVHSLFIISSLILSAQQFPQLQYGMMSVGANKWTDILPRFDVLMRRFL